MQEISVFFPTTFMRKRFIQTRVLTFVSTWLLIGDPWSRPQADVSKCSDLHIHCLPRFISIDFTLTESTLWWANKRRGMTFTVAVSAVWTTIHAWSSDTAGDLKNLRYRGRGTTVIGMKHLTVHFIISCILWCLSACQWCQHVLWILGLASTHQTRAVERLIAGQCQRLSWTLLNTCQAFCFKGEWKEMHCQHHFTAKQPRHGKTFRQRYVWCQ